MRLTQSLAINILTCMDRYIDFLDREDEDISSAMELMDRIRNDEDLTEEDVLVIGQVQQLFSKPIINN